VAGRFTKEHTKLRIPPAVFSSLFAKFDKVLLESEGSKQIPVKGWETIETVIIPETTITIGLMPIAGLGKTISSATVHRLPLFLRSTDTKAGQIILEETLANIIASPVGLWAKSRGQRILCLNQVETASQLLQARTVASLLPHSLLTRLSKVIACNIQT
ncbi:selenium cofactor biosynthesis protein YqeC, partial [Enterococcus faecalis]